MTRENSDYQDSATRQLYSLTPAGFKWPAYVDLDGKVVTRTAGNMPLMTWPDGSWCCPANTYMRELLEQGLSRRNRGGSLSVAAAHISHLLRYCWARRTDVIDLTDNQFCEFIDQLQTEKHNGNQRKKPRGTNSVIAIGKTCLAFLDSVARQAGDSSFIGRDGRIRAYIKEQRIKTKWQHGALSKKAVRGWTHPALPELAPLNRRMPISTENVEKMRMAVAEISTTSHQRMRRHTLLKLLEVTGARRGEIAQIAVRDVEQAAAMEFPMLRIVTLKKRSAQHRYIPISRADLAFVMQYVDFHRRSVVRRRLKGKPDHGTLLINGRTGDPLQPNTLTQEIRILAKAAGIAEKACPHMFRHRFLTKLFVSLIEQHHFDNPEEFRRSLIDGEAMKRKVAEWTDHASLDSLNIYINLAFDEVANFRQTSDLTQVRMAVESFRGTIDATIAALKSKEPLPVVTEQFERLLREFKRDFDMLSPTPQKK